MGWLLWDGCCGTVAVGRLLFGYGSVAVGRSLSIVYCGSVVMGWSLWVGRFVGWLLSDGRFGTVAVGRLLWDGRCLVMRWSLEVVCFVSVGLLSVG